MALEILKKEIEVVTKDKKLAIPSWAITIILVLILNAFTIAFSAGAVSSRLASLEARFATLEVRFNTYMDTKAEDKH